MNWFIRIPVVSGIQIPWVQCIADSKAQDSELHRKIAESGFPYNIMRRVERPVDFFFIPINIKAIKDIKKDSHSFSDGMC